MTAKQGDQIVCSKSAQFSLKMPQMAPNLIFTKGLNHVLVTLETYTSSHWPQRSSRLTESGQIFTEKIVPEDLKVF